MPDNITHDSDGARATSQPGSWMLYGAAGHTGALIAQHACERGHRPVLAGRSAPAVAALAEQLGLQHRAVALDDPAALNAALAGVHLVLNAAGPFLHTAAPLAEACLRAGVHYLDIGNELQVFRTLYDLDQRARQAGVTIMPGVGFGVVATNCLARHVSDTVGGAVILEVATRAATAQQGPGVAATRQQNMPYGGWIRQAGHLEPCPSAREPSRSRCPTGRVSSCPCRPVTSRQPSRPPAQPTSRRTAPCQAIPPPASTGPRSTGDEHPAYRSFGWARATGPDGATAEAWLQTGESYAFTAAASIRAVEEALARSLSGAFSPAAAFGADFVLTIPGTSRTDTIPQKHR